MTNDQEKLPINSAANQCKLFFGSQHDNCRDDIRSLTNSPTSNQVYACITNNMQPVTKQLKISQNSNSNIPTKISADIGGINTPFICSRDEKNLLSRTTTVTPSGKFFIANSYKDGKFMMQLFRQERLMLLIQDKGSSEADLVDNSGFKEPIFINAFGVNVTAATNRKVRSSKKNNNRCKKWHAKKLKYKKYKKTSKVIAKPVTNETEIEYLAPDPNEEIWLFLTENESGRTVSRAVLLHTRQTGKEHDVWINYFKITAECQIASGLVLEVLVAIRRTNLNQFLAVFTNQDRTISGICVFNDFELRQKFRFNSNAKIIGKKQNGVDFIGHQEFINRVEASKDAVIKNSGSSGSACVVHNGDYFSECFEPNIDQKQFLNNHRLLEGKLSKKSKWWAKLSVKDFAISPNFRDYMFLITRDNKLIRMQNISQKPKAIEEIKLTNFQDSNKYRIQPVKFLHVFEKNRLANVVVVKRNSYEIITFGEDRFCLKSCCLKDCCDKNRPFCAWDDTNKKCRAGLKSRARISKVDYERIPAEILMRKRKSDGFVPLKYMDLPQSGIVKPFRSHFSSAISSSKISQKSALELLFDKHRIDLQNELSFLDTPEEYSRNNQCPNWAVVSCLVEREYSSVWDRYKNIRDDLKDSSLQHKLSLKRNSVSDWELVEENIELWFGHIKKLLERGGLNEKVSNDVILVSDRVWEVMSTYMLSIGIECYSNRVKISNLVRGTTGGQCGLKMSEQSYKMHKNLF